MRPIVLVFLAVLFGLAFGLGLMVMELGPSLAGTVDASLSIHAAVVSPDGPHVVADAEDFDFGSMERESHKSHVFKISNEGKSLLQLKKGETTCRCTKFEIAKTDLNPGESTDVTIEWHATVPPGPFRQSASIDTNDPARPQLSFAIHGDVTSSYRLVPSEVTFSGVSVTEPHSAEVNIYSYRPGKLEVTSHRFTEQQTADKFDLTIEPMPAEKVSAEKDAQSGVVVHVSVKPGLPLGAFHQKIELRINQSDDPVDIPIDGTTVSDVLVAGRGWDDEHALLTFGTISAREGAKSDLFILAHGPHRKDLHPTIQSVTPESLKVTLGQPQGGDGDSPVRVPVTVEVPPGLNPVLHLGGEEGKLGEILINTGHPDAKTVRIRVRYAIGD